MYLNNKNPERSEESDDDNVDVCVGCYLFQTTSVEYGSDEWVKFSRRIAFRYLVRSAKTIEGDMCMECYGYDM